MTRNGARLRNFIVGSATRCISGLAQSNHIYMGEAWDATQSRNKVACTKYQVDSRGTSFDIARYPWNAKVRRAGKPDVLYGTAFAQQIIWDHQHPVDCTGVKFLTMLHWPVGIGALLHFLARALGLAMHLGRILVLSIENFNPKRGDAGMPWYDHRFCPGMVSWECWFQPLTSCVEHADSDTMVVQPEELGRFRVGNFSRHYVPEVFHEMLRECSHVKTDLEFYWWHAQAIAYIVRFNKNTRRQLDKLRSELLQDCYAGCNSSAMKGLPHGTVAMHVRHGDKGREMQILPVEMYWEQARRLASGDQGIQVLEPEFSSGGQVFTYPRSMFAAKSAFVSTEDPLVISETMKLAKAVQGVDGNAVEQPWHVFFTRENRTNVDVETMRKQRGNGRATLESFLNLELALEADAWICTLFSNWCQLIDELRMTVGAKASAPYINIVRKGSAEKCPAFHRRCYINWR